MSISFDRAASFYDRTRSIPADAHARGIELMREAGRLDVSSRVLEVGVGTGRIAVPLSEHVAGMFGVDISRGMLGQLQAKRGERPVYVAQADATRLPFPSGAFDGAVAVHIFHLIPDWKKALAEVARVLRPGGLMVQARTFSGFKDLYEAMREAAPLRPAGLGFDDRWTAPLDEGWQQVGEPLLHPYTLTEKPQTFLDAVAARSSSLTWTLSDEELARVRAAVEARIAELWGDPAQEVEQAVELEVRAYRPPEG